MTSEEYKALQARVDSKKPSKYKAIKTKVGNITFDSKKEAARFGILSLLERKGEIKQLERQVVYDLVVNGVLICKYKADFKYLDWNTKTWVVEDVKGLRKGAAYQVFKVKAKLVKALLGIEIKEV